MALKYSADNNVLRPVDCEVILDRSKHAVPQLIGVLHLTFAFSGAPLLRVRCKALLDNYGQQS